jgi:hypothetical protein
MSEVDHSVNHEIYARGSTPAIEQEPTDLETEIELRARRIRRLYPGDRLHAQAALQSRIRTMEKNIAQGYREYIDAVEVEKRVLELSKIGIME